MFIDELLELLLLDDNESLEQLLLEDEQVSAGIEGEINVRPVKGL